MDNLKKILDLEITIQSRLLNESKEAIKYAPEGYLSVRERPQGADFYQTRKIRTAKGWKNENTNINHDQERIQALIEKMIAVRTEKNCKKNLPLMKEFLETYQPYARDEIIQKLPSKYKKAIDLYQQKQMETWLAASYIKCPFDRSKHIHETAYGELVRSKSEVIIANALFGYGIPIRYEERFPYPSENGDFYFPDFTIWLPDGRRLVWEHLGLLSEMGYCIDNAQKLHTYQQNNVVIGKNLILTQDDNHGNCSSETTYRIINDDILPHFAGLELESAGIKKSPMLHRISVNRS